MSASEHLINAAANTKVAAVVAAGTTGTGLGAALTWIPDDIGKLATLIGILLSLVLIWSHLLVAKKTRTELSIMVAKEAARMQAIEQKRRTGD